MLLFLQLPGKHGSSGLIAAMGPPAGNECGIGGYYVTVLTPHHEGSRYSSPAGYVRPMPRTSRSLFAVATPNGAVDFRQAIVRA